MPEGITPLTRQPKTVREWLENVRSRGGDDAEWAHHLLREDHHHRRIDLGDTK